MTVYTHLSSPIGPLLVVGETPADADVEAPGPSAAAAPDRGPSMAPDRGPAAARGPSAASGLVLTGLYMEEHRRGPAVSPAWQEDPAAFSDVARELDEYFAGSRRTFDLPLAPRGTPFQLQVWEELRRIPEGDTVTYGELADRVGRPRASRAVGAAVGRNPISVIVPCHRVVGSDGSLTGFAGGLERKRTLLALEGAPVATRA